MTPLPAPRLGLAILNRLADRNEALAGDLLEGYRLRQSRVWFWRELLGAIASGSFRKTEIRPLKLVEFPSWKAPLENFEAKRRKLQTLGLSASPVEGIGGLSIIAIVFFITLFQPVLWVMLSAGFVAGTAVGLALAAYRRRHRPTPGSDLTTVVLFPHHGG